MPFSEFHARDNSLISSFNPNPYDIYVLKRIRDSSAVQPLGIWFILFRLHCFYAICACSPRPYLCSSVGPTPTKPERTHDSPRPLVGYEIITFTDTTILSPVRIVLHIFNPNLKRLIDKLSSKALLAKTKTTVFIDTNIPL